jgi:subtilisin family serine protease
MCIAASDNQDKIADFSNRGESVVMASPGYLILSTVNKGNDVYEKWNGTSMATPVTAGAAAILWSLYPEFRGSEIETILRATQDKVLSLTQSFASGAGRLNLAAAITYAEELSPSNDDGTPQLASHNTPTLDGGIGKVSNQPRSGDAGADGPANTIGQREEDLPICIDEPCSATASAQEGCGTISSKKNPSGTSPISLWFLLLFPILMAIVSIAAPQKPTKNSFN